MRIQTPNMPSGSNMIIPIMMSPMAMLLKFSSPTSVNHCFETATINANTVIPAEAGIQSFQDLLDSRFRGNDKKGRFSNLSFPVPPALPQKGHVIQYFFMRIQTPNMPSGSNMIIPIMMSPMAMLLKFSSPTSVNHCFERATISAPK